MQGFDTADREAGFVDRIGFGQSDAFEAAQQGGEDDFHIQSGEVVAEAEMRAAAEGQMAVRAADDIKAVGVGELCRIAVGGIAAGMIAQISLSLRIDHRLNRIEKTALENAKDISGVSARLEERTNPRQLRVVEDA